MSIAAVKAVAPDYTITVHADTSQAVAAIEALAAKVAPLAEQLAVIVPPRTEEVGDELPKVSP